MRRAFTLELVFLALLALPAWAAEAPKRSAQGIAVYSVSPGTSGSISGSAYSQNREGLQVPGLPSDVSTRSSRVYGTSTVRQTGAMRQTLEYPNGMRVPQQSVQGSYQQQRDE